MTTQSSLSRTSNTPLKIFTGIFAFYVLISSLSILPMLLKGADTLVFYDGLNKLVLNAFYAFIGFKLLQLIYNLKSGLVDLIAQRSVKILAHIWYALVGLLLFKVVTELSLGTSSYLV